MQKRLLLKIWSQRSVISLGLMLLEPWKIFCHCSCTILYCNFSFTSRAPIAKGDPDFLFSVPFVSIIGSESQISALHALGCL